MPHNVAGLSTVVLPLNLAQVGMSCYATRVLSPATLEKKSGANSSPTFWLSCVLMQFRWCCRQWFYFYLLFLISNDFCFIQLTEIFIGSVLLVLCPNDGNKTYSNGLFANFKSLRCSIHIFTGI